ncbi:MAG: aldo/keto reductase [Proteiniphilum sp.]|jgi:aryl-alcohol dehydrogenase-like predicted oxidoreductase|nr:aldo/keto reductase [Proteiniphilum sp.]
MKKLSRRDFLRTGFAGFAGLTMVRPGSFELTLASEIRVDKVKLGNSGLDVSRIALGTGSKGGAKASNQTRLGMESFTKMAHHAYEKGISFFDMADSYGSHQYVGNAIKSLPREKLTLLTKIWTHEDGSDKIVPVRESLDRYRQEMNTDYIDIVLMHCLMKGGWSNNRKHYMEGLSKAKQDGIIKAVGVSCHNWDAMVEAVDNPWVDVIMARINPFQSHMDGTPDVVKELLGKAKKNGIGVIGMKIFGEGRHVSDDEREQSLRFALTDANIHCMTLGMESTAHVDDAAKRVMRLAKENKIH